MRQTARILSTYSADTFGVCSALFELGGMVIMHDASGCNSTYTTHDEPRWYDMDSLLYITGLSELEAIMGDDEKVINDITRAADSLNPRFIAICGTPIPAMTGTDFEAVARVIEERTNIPSLGIPTTGMKPYVCGISAAFAKFAKRFVKAGTVQKGTANILGLTPLDFSLNGQDLSIIKSVEKRGYRVLSRWAMGCSFDELCGAAAAEVNFVVSSGGIELARFFKDRFGTPFIVGLPFGGSFADVTEVLKDYSYDKRDVINCAARVRVFGEAVYSAALAKDIERGTGLSAEGIDATKLWEDDIIRLMQGAQYVIADPMFSPVCPESVRFISLPHEACSGRIYRDEIPDLMTDNIILTEVKGR